MKKLLFLLFLVNNVCFGQSLITTPVKSIYTSPIVVTNIPAPHFLMKVSGTTFIDVSSNAYPLTISGNVITSIDAPFANQKSLAVSSGTGKLIISTPGTNFNVGTNDFTIAAWIKMPLDGATNETFIFTRAFGGSNYIIVYVNNNGSLSCQAYHPNAGYPNISSAASVISANIWQHVAFVKNGNVFSVYANGNRVNTVTTTGVNLNSSNATNPGVGGYSHDSYGDNNGLIFDCGFWLSALYTGATYTIPTAPY